MDDKYLACASSSATVHIFELREDQCNPTSVPNIASMKDLASSMKDLTEAATTQNVAAALPTYFQANRATAIFRIPDSDIDLRAKSSTILGPQVCFAEDDRFYVLHYTGLLYEVRYDVEGRKPPSSLQLAVSQVSGSQHVQSVFDECCQCTVADATTWFAARPEFKLYRQEESDEKESDWNMI